MQGERPMTTVPECPFCSSGGKPTVSDAVKGMKRRYLERELAKAKLALRESRARVDALRLERDTARWEKQQMEQEAKLQVGRALLKKKVNEIAAGAPQKVTPTRIADILLRYDARGDPGKLYPLAERIEAILRAAATERAA